MEALWAAGASLAYGASSSSRPAGQATGQHCVDMARRRPRAHQPTACSSPHACITYHYFSLLKYHMLCQKPYYYKLIKRHEISTVWIQFAVKREQKGEGGISNAPNQVVTHQSGSAALKTEAFHAPHTLSGLHPLPTFPPLPTLGQVSLEVSPNTVKLRHGNCVSFSQRLALGCALGCSRCGTKVFTTLIVRLSLIASQVCTRSA